jgi:DNA-binding transcriptional MerR regulator
MMSMQTSAIQIAELAKRTTLTVDAIRFYEKRHLLPKATRAGGGFRLYTTDDIERLHSFGRCTGLVSPCEKSEN